MLGTTARKYLVTLGSFVISGLGIKELGQEATEGCWENSNIEGGFYSVVFACDVNLPYCIVYIIFDRLSVLIDASPTSEFLLGVRVFLETS